MHHPHPAPSCHSRRSAPRALASASPIAPPRPTLALLSAAHARERGVRAACSAPAARRGRGGRWLVCQSWRLLPPLENSPENFPSLQVNFDDERDRDHRYSAFAPHSLPELATKKGGVGRRRVCFFGQKLCFTASIDATHTPRTAPSGTHPPALRTRPPRGSARVTRGMSPWYPSSSRETTRKSFGGAGGVGARRRPTPAHQPTPPPEPDPAA